MEQYNIDFHGIKTKALDYKGVQLIFNSLNGKWMLFFHKNRKYGNQSPFAGTLQQMKKIIDDAIKIGKDGEKYLMEEGTYKKE